uniref:Uncharacterized protein n=1 Tax=Anguilla anguilla TaxID=7936 RepID=A0A0E9UZ98_ANGAN
MHVQRYYHSSLLFSFTHQTGISDPGPTFWPVHILAQLYGIVLAQSYFGVPHFLLLLLFPDSSGHYSEPAG